MHVEARGVNDIQTLTCCFGLRNFKNLVRFTSLKFPDFP